MPTPARTRCTGAGCSLALIQAFRLASILAELPDDPCARARAFEATSDREVHPSYEFAIQMDRMGADPAGAGALAGAGEGGEAMAAVFVAGATDPVIGRGLMRLWNLLATPEDLMQDPEFVDARDGGDGEPRRVPTAGA